MHLIEIFLPLSDEKRRPFPEDVFRKVQDRLVEQFGGVTAFTRSPAEGLWQAGDRKVSDDIVVIEVMADQLDRSWWGRFKGDMQRDFDQSEILILASQVEKL
jgi:hypothetical protein